MAQAPNIAVLAEEFKQELPDLKKALAIIEGSGINRQHAFKVLTTLLRAAKASGLQLTAAEAAAFGVELVHEIDSTAEPIAG